METTPMSRLRSALAAAVLWTSVFPPGACPAPTPAGKASAKPSAIDQAHDQVPVGCKAAPGACEELTAVYDGYIAQINRLEPCTANKPGCTADLVLSVLREGEALDARENKLPAAARGDGRRPLLRVSLVLSQIATFALANASKDASAIDVFAKTSQFAPKDVDSFCASGAEAGHCSDARFSLSTVQSLDRFLKSCEQMEKTHPCDFDVLDLESEEAEASMNAYERAAKDQDSPLMTLFTFIKYGEDRLSLLVRREMTAQADKLDAGLADLSGKVDALSRGGDVAAAEAKYNDAADAFRKSSIAADRVGSFGYNADGKIRDRLNAAAARMAALRGTIAAADADAMAHGLAVGPKDAGLVQKASYSPMKASLGVAGGAAPTLLDRKLIPPPAPRSGKAPPIIDKKLGLFAIIKNLSSKDPLVRADARRRAGMTYTVGDPLGRADLVHAQQHSDSCAVVAQQEIMTAMHLVSGDEPNKTEQELYEEARRRGFIRTGTPDVYTADLLIDKGVIVTKKASVPITELDAAVRRGGFVIANVDARRLWDLKGQLVLGHAIVITGAEIDKSSGETLGYYINDSGQNPPGRGRFVTMEKFRKAWNPHTKSYAEVR